MLIRGLYSWGISGAYALLYPWLRKKYAPGFKERQGWYDEDLLALGKKSPLWIHGVSVGEVQAAAPLVEAMREEVLPGPLCFSTITPTGRAMAELLLASRADRFFYYPWDVPRIIRRALEKLNPRMYVTMETEIWPVLLAALQDRGVPAFLVNGRFSHRTFARAKRYRRLYSSMLNRFERLYLRNPEEKERALALGVAPEKIRVTGENKAGAMLERKKAPLPRLPLPREGESLLLGGSTHSGEDAVVLKAAQELWTEGKFFRLILVPRHPERAPEVAREARGFGKVRLLSEKNSPEGWDILVVDRIGVLFPLYSRVQGAFIGGSLIPKGGQNLMEPAAWGVPIQHGPHMEDFASIAKDLKRLGCSAVVTSSEELARAWRGCLEEPEVHERARKGIAYVESLDGAARRAWGDMKSYL